MLLLVGPQLHNIICTFVSKMLDSSSFNKLLSGARECNKILSTAVKECDAQPNGDQLLQVLCCWGSLFLAMGCKLTTLLYA